MKPGSIAVILPLGEISPLLKPYIKWLPVDDEKTHYMVREIKSAINDSYVICYFEEGVVGHYKGFELGIDIRYVREVLPPDDINEVIEEIISEPMAL